MNKDFKTRWEFIFKYNDFIVCQRFFKVIGYNHETLSSSELKETLDEICDDIAHDIKNRTLDFMSNNSTKFYAIENFEVSRGSNNAFTFSVAVDGKPRITKYMDADIYPNTVRSSVDIRESIPEIISKLQVALSLKEYETVTQ